MKEDAKFNPFFGTHTAPYRTDLALLKSLGLEPFEAPNKTKHFVGEVTLTTEEAAPYAKVRIFVDCCPAQFWTFEIDCYETGKTLVIGTGSGSLTDYWPIAAKFAENLLDVEFYGDTPK